VTSLKTQAARIASLLTDSLGTTAREEVSKGRIRIEAEVPDDLDETLRRMVLASLNSTADRFGHELKDGKPILWAELDQESPL
jgi:hypothetical protein